MSDTDLASIMPGTFKSLANVHELELNRCKLTTLR